MSDTRQRLIRYLKAAPRQWVSGQQISDRLGITRAAIWKQIQALKEQGYTIASAPKKGYRLEQATDRMEADDIRACLETRLMGRDRIICLGQTDSTNSRAKQLAADGAAEGTVVVAESQTSGRGRRGRSWFSPPGRSIYGSIILRPPMAPSRAPQITLMTAVAVARTLQETAGLNATIKWPNDILIADKKIAGILTEITTEMDVVDYVVVGLGVNINTTAADMPPDLRPIATSVRIESGSPFSRIDLLCSLLHHFESSYDMLQRDGFKPIMAQWRKMSDIIGRPVYVDVLDVRHTGVVEAVDDDGVLVLKDDNGQWHRIFSGDVTRIRKKNVGIV
jgi:BirA family biotin operon repressor/biotin-[acetyl-CoA-carboxylase] ligase